MPRARWRPIAGALALAVLAASLPLGTASAQSGSTHEYRYLMGTSVEVEAYGGDEPTRRSAIAEAFGAIAEVDRLMSNYRGDSELSLVNRRAALDAVTVSDPMFSVLQAAAHVSRQSNGAFDITVGPLVRLWGFHDKTPHVPSRTELAAVRPLVGYRNVILDADHRTVRFTRPGTELDLGGIAKGFAVELAAGVLRRHGLDGFIDAGGNQYLLGVPAGKHLWTVGVKNPDAPGQLLGVVDTEETSVSTSANYANFLVADGRRYGHLLDPRTLEPSSAAEGVTIFARDGTLADAMSKAVFVLGPAAGLALVDSMPGVSALVAYRNADGSLGLRMSPRLARAFHPTARR